MGINNVLPKAYSGDRPYIFISYAHKDSDTVVPIINRLQSDEYRVWYDEGIAPGSNWDVYISEHLDKCSSVLAFMSESYIKSHNCRDELALSRSKGKHTIIIYVDDAELSSGMKMRYGRIQALSLLNTGTEEVLNKLYGIETLNESNN